MVSTKELKKKEKPNSHQWPDLPSSFRWVLRLVFLGLLGLVGFGLYSICQTIWIEARINNGRDYTYRVVPPVGGIETKLDFKTFVDAEWLNNEEIIILGSNEELNSKPHPYFFEIFDLSSNLWRVVNHEDLDQFCPEGSISIQDAELEPFQPNQLIFTSPCTVKPAANLDPLATHTVILLLTVEHDKAQFELVSTINRASNFNPDEDFSLAVAPNLEEIAFGSTSPNDDLSNDLMIADFKLIHPSPTAFDPKINVGPFTHIDWQSNNEKLAISAYQGNKEQLDSDGIYLVDLNSKESERLTPRTSTVKNLEWINDDQELFLVGRLIGRSGAWILKPESKEIWFYNIQANYRIPDLSIAQSPMSISPDESQIFGIAKTKSHIAGRPYSLSLRVIEYESRREANLESSSSIRELMVNTPKSPELEIIENQYSH